MRTQDLPSVGWVGTGRMGSALCRRLLAAGYDLAVFNRTRAKAEALGALGAQVVDRPADLAGRPVVFTSVMGPEDLLEVTAGPGGVLTGPAVPRVLIDLSTVSLEVSAQVRTRAGAMGTAFLAAPVSGNPKVAEAGRLSMVVSGPRQAFDEVRPLLERLVGSVTYAGEREVARLIKICHQLFLAVVTQSLAEVTVLAQRGGVPRSTFLEFLNRSVVGSTFTRYKTPAFVNLDLTPTATVEVLLKDLEIGLETGRELGVPLPTAAVVRELTKALLATGFAGRDFGALLELQARCSGLGLEPEGVEVSDGLEPDELARAAGLGGSPGRRA
ncbi:MAG TPA: NAD(P)-dependent oxidoreductase [Actinomycetota bacterium]|nr:NAD(P)-dependent oxidoreductase [Actinomycetota bacterium]